MKSKASENEKSKASENEKGAVSLGLGNNFNLLELCVNMQ